MWYIYHNKMEGIHRLVLISARKKCGKFITLKWKQYCMCCATCTTPKNVGNVPHHEVWSVEVNVVNLTQKQMYSVNLPRKCGQFTEYITEGQLSRCKCNIKGTLMRPWYKHLCPHTHLPYALDGSCKTPDAQLALHRWRSHWIYSGCAQETRAHELRPCCSSFNPLI